MATFSETWTAANGATWPAVWSISAGGGATVDIQSNAGRMSTPSWAVAQRTGCPTDGEALFRLQFTGLTVQFLYFHFRRVNATGDGYYVILDPPSEFAFKKIVTGGHTQLASASVTYTVGWWWVRIRWVGNSLQARVWADGGSEPGTWNLATTDATFASGPDLQLEFSHDGAAGTIETSWDDLTVTDLATTQTAAPASDVTTTGWTTTGGTGTAASALDEVTPDDADYVTSPAAPSASVFEVKFTSIIDPATSANHVLSYRLRAVAGSHSVVVGLYQGATLIASWTETGLTSSFQTIQRTLTGGQADAITDYTDLRLRVTATAS